MAKCVGILMATTSSIFPTLANSLHFPAETYSVALRLKELEEQISSVRASLICAFNQLLDLKDLNTGYHSTRLAEWSVRVAQELGMPEDSFEDVEITALLHDIGKIGVPDSILKKPAKLEVEEYELMKKHPEYGWGIIRLFPSFERIGHFILHHHESFDGKGYPGGLQGSEIPFGSRIIAVVDSFDAMVSSRPYRQGLPFEEALRRLIIASGTQFDPRVVQSFIRIAQSEMPSVFAATGTSTSVVL
jgi:HD-GYP domain-containing protein (c-di-GMP phosphodiesterase class II)